MSHAPELYAMTVLLSSYCVLCATALHVLAHTCLGFSLYAPVANLCAVMYQAQMWQDTCHDC